MAIKNIGELGLDEITEDYLMAECEDMGAELGVDTNQGSIYRDASDGHIIRVAKFFNDLATVNEILSITTCTGDVLTEKMMERGMARNPPADTAATYYVEFVGAEPQVGDLMSCDDHFFTAQKLENRWVIVSEETGTDMNTLVPGLPVIPDQDVDNLISATLKEIAIPAVDMEEDDSARSRYIDKLSGPAENGNKVQIRSWCEEIQGVGRTRIVPLWNGDCTVLGIIISTEGTEPAESVVKLVQDTIDPGAQGFGEGKATFGCFFTAVAAKKQEISIKLDVTKKAESTYNSIQTSVSNAVKAYLKELALNSTQDEIIIRYNNIGALISNISDIVDFDNLLVNGGKGNVTCDIYHVPVIGEVEVNGSL